MLSHVLLVTYSLCTVVHMEKTPVRFCDILLKIISNYIVCVCAVSVLYWSAYMYLCTVYINVCMQYVVICHLPKIMACTFFFFNKDGAGLVI